MRRDTSGFTLIEFAICSATTMAMLAGTFTLMNMMFTSNERLGDVMATQQNVRVAMNTMARDITMAGTGLPTGTVAIPNGTGFSAIVRPGMSGFTSPARNLEVQNNSIPMISAGNGDGPTVSTATDALSVFSINQESPTWNVSSVVIVTGATGRYEITFTQPVNTGALVLVPGDLLLFTNANGSVLACVSDISTTSPYTKAFFRATPDGVGVNQPGAASGNFGSIKNAGTTQTYPPTTASRVNLVTYFISNSTAAHPRLMRAVNANAAEAIAEDIENLQFSYDLFDTASGVETSNVDTTTSPNQIRSVSVAITGRSPAKMQRTNDYYRFSLVSKINVRNSTFRNRYNGT